MTSFALRWVGVLVLLPAVAVGAYLLGLRPIGAEPPKASAAAGSIQQWELQQQYTGPLKDTLVQRWRDPANGAICYIYLPVIVQHSQPLQNGLIHYGANDIGSISCLPH